MRRLAAKAPTTGPLVLYCRAAGLPEPVCEFRFHPTRRWRFDYAWPDRLLAVEVEGGAWTGGRHTTGAGFVSDMEKYNAATLAGWRILRYLPRQLKLAPSDLRTLLVLDHA